MLCIRSISFELKLNWLSFLMLPVRRIENPLIQRESQLKLPFHDIEQLSKPEKVYSKANKRNTKQEKVVVRNVSHD